jgi:ATP-dependent Clp protease ATP-binding subunit ClpA
MNRAQSAVPDDAKPLLAAAQYEAWLRGTEQARAEHVLAALLRLADTDLERALAQAGVSRQKLASELESTFPPVREGAPTERLTLALDPEVTAAVQNATGPAAPQQNFKQSALFLRIVEAPAPALAKVLRAADVSHDRVAEAVRRIEAESPR